MNGILKRPDCELYYEVTGSGPALVFAHGLGGNYLSWWQQIPCFEKSHTCVTFSHRGFWPNAAVSVVPTPAVFADDLAALIDHLRLDDVSLVAQSMGGWTCLEYALSHPSRVRALVMASSTGTLNVAAITHVETERMKEWTEWSEREKERLRALGLIPATGARMAEEQPSLHYLYRQINDLTPAVYKEAVRAAIHKARTLPSEKLSVLSLPFLLLTGEEDLVFPPMAASAAASLVPGASLRSLSKTGHSGYFERAGAFNRIVGEFLAATARSLR